MVTRPLLTLGCPMASHGVAPCPDERGVDGVCVCARAHLLFEKWHDRGRCPAPARRVWLTSEGGSQDARLDRDTLLAKLANLEDAPSAPNLEHAVDSCRRIFEEAARRGLSAAEFEAFLGEDEVCASVDEGLVAPYLAVWRRQEAKVQEAMHRRSFWGKKLKRVAWRVDVTTNTRHTADLNEPCALMELELCSAASSAGATKDEADTEGIKEVMRFEVDRRALAEMHASCERLSALISNA